MKTKISARDVRIIGQTEALLAVSIAVVLDLSIFLYDNLNLSEATMKHAILDIISFFALGQIFGVIASRLILLHHFSSALVGVATAWLTLIAITIAHCAWTELLGGTVFPNVFGICTVVFIVGFLPSGIHGAWFGFRIEKRGQKLRS